MALRKKGFLSFEEYFSSVLYPRYVWSCLQMTVENNYAIAMVTLKLVIG